jgi:hypothetical protein
VRFYGVLKNPMSIKYILCRNNTAAIASPNFSCSASRCLC